MLLTLRRIELTSDDDFAPPSTEDNWRIYFLTHPQEDPLCYSPSGGSSSSQMMISHLPPLKILTLRRVQLTTDDDFTPPSTEDFQDRRRRRNRQLPVCTSLRSDTDSRGRRLCLERLQYKINKYKIDYITEWKNNAKSKLEMKVRNESFLYHTDGRLIGFTMLVLLWEIFFFSSVRFFCPKVD